MRRLSICSWHAAGRWCEPFRHHPRNKFYNKVAFVIVPTIKEAVSIDRISIIDSDNSGPHCVGNRVQEAARDARVIALCGGPFAVLIVWLATVCAKSDELQLFPEKQGFRMADPMSVELDYGSVEDIEDTMNT
jgi:hypothetical protein